MNKLHILGILIFYTFIIILFTVAIGAIFHGVAGISPLKDYEFFRIIYILTSRVLGYDVVSVFLIIPLILLTFIFGIALFEYQKYIINFEKRVFDKIGIEKHENDVISFKNNENEFIGEVKKMVTKRVKAQMKKEFKIRKKYLKKIQQKTDSNVKDE